MSLVRAKLTNFISNIREVLKTNPGERHHQKIRDQDLNISDIAVESALSVHRISKNFYISFRINLIEKRLTKKARFSTISSVYDPGIAEIAATFV